MKVIWVTPHCPHPEGGGGSAHEFHLLRHVAHHHDVRVISSYTSGPRDESALEALGIEVRTVRSKLYPYPNNKYGVGLALVRARPTLVLWTQRERWKDTRRALEQLEAQWSPDLVHVSLGELAPVLRDVRGPSSLLLFDSYLQHVERRLPIEPHPRRRLQLRFERRRTVAWEGRWYQKATAIACVSDVDAAHFRALLGRDIDVIENPVADEYFAEPAVKRRADTVAFIGSLLYPPNKDAIEWLLADIWPRIHERRPDARLVIAGRGDGDPHIPELCDLIESAGGEVHVDVPDVRPYYWEASAVIAPIRMGAGLRNKVIHAMACSAPVVATPTAVEGIAVRPGEDLLVSQTADGLADAVVQTLNDPEAARGRATSAARAMRSHAADVIGERFERWWESAAGLTRP